MTVDATSAVRQTRHRARVAARVAAERRRADLALQACRLLVAAYQNGAGAGGSIDWSDVDAAFEVAEDALDDSPRAVGGV